ncbi:hypothetical protein NUW58_g3540 [Xylaria curta]|uniref:Uncharacterized protein n=1 Tax=Xylaria curta TaxID=42375 RepID=A0ACC1PBG5_9PEZI|nr:hypothetical protein NUW58_g3540 [Xylaria curta]
MDARLGDNSDPRPSSDGLYIHHDDEPLQGPSTTLGKEEAQPDAAYAGHRWQPRYLQRWILLSSCLLCISFIVAVELLFWYSSTKHGLGESDNSLHYLWTYGPTAILTVVGAIWTRIDYQAKMAAPWNRLAQGPAVAKKTLLLDYIDALQPVAAVNAIKNRDFGVAAAAIIALGWGLNIAISASLISLTPTKSQPTTVPVELTTMFTNDPSGLETAASLSYYNMLGIQEANLTLPEGVSGGYTYQRFDSPTIPPTTELHTTIDGFSASLVCEESSYHVDMASWHGLGRPFLNFTMATGNCEIKSGWWAPLYRSGAEAYYSRFGTGSCQNSSDPDDQRIAVTFGSLKFGKNTQAIPFPGSPVDVNITKSVNMLCRPTYAISKINAVKNGSEVLSLMPSLSPGLITLDKVHAWDFTRALVRSTHNAVTSLDHRELMSNSQPFNASDIVFDTDPTTYLVLGQLSKPPPPSTSILKTSALKDLVTRYYQMHTLFIANDLLVRPASIESTGQAILYQERLIVNGTAAHVMAGILAAAVLLFGTMIITIPKFSVLACAPSSISGIARLAIHSHELIWSLKSLGRSNSKTLATRLDDCSYMTSVQDGDAFYQGDFVITTTDSPAQDTNIELKDAPSINPIPLRPWFRAGISFIVIGIIIALETTLQASQRNQGIGAAPAGPSYLHYSWTAVPALVFTITSLTYGSIDSSIRKLTPYVNLRHGSTFGRTLGLNLLDLGMPRMLFRETHTRSFAALSGTLAALIASLLAIISSSLFVLSNVPLVAPVQLRIERSLSNSSLKSAEKPIISTITPPLILESNLGYPIFTYENLVFPTLSLYSNGTTDDGFSLNATIPAVRPKMDCHLHDKSSVTTDLSISSILQINITEATCPSPRVSRVRPRGDDAIRISADGIAAGAVTVVCPADDGRIENVGTYRWAYFWAEVRRSPEPTVVSASVLVCNESVEAVNVFTSFIGANFTIDPDNPPVPDEATAHNTTASIPDWMDLYFGLPNGPYAMLDKFFSALVSSRYGIPLEYLRDASKSGVVQDAIIFQHSIIRSLWLNDQRNELPENTNAFTAGSAESDAVSYQANLTEAKVQIRVVQDEVSTRVLQGLLAAILGLSLLSWVLMPKTKILPREPTSIASVMALLADGNIFELLPTESQLLKEKEIESLFAGATFQMGWAASESLGSGENTGDEEMKFSVFGFKR